VHAFNVVLFRLGKQQQSMLPYANVLLILLTGMHIEIESFTPQSQINQT